LRLKYSLIDQVYLIKSRINLINYIYRMNCRENCGACCIALSISSSIPGMPEGKPEGVRCINLMDDYRCAVYNGPGYPAVCSGFNAEPEFCGQNRDEALEILYSLSDCAPST
jgi:hypothetical protein